jgi:hypothetical protein
MNNNPAKRFGHKMEITREFSGPHFSQAQVMCRMLPGNVKELAIWKDRARGLRTDVRLVLCPSVPPAARWSGSELILVTPIPILAPDEKGRR